MIEFINCGMDIYDDYEEMLEIISLIKDNLLKGVDYE